MGLWVSTFSCLVNSLSRIMNATLSKALVALVPVSIPFVGSLLLFVREKILSSFLQLVGAGCLVEAQAQAAGIPLWHVDLPWPCSNADYERIMKDTCKAAVQAGIECIAFGDLFLTEIRAYREKQLENSGLQPIFPVWGMPTQEL